MARPIARRTDRNVFRREFARKDEDASSNYRILATRERYRVIVSIKLFPECRKYFYFFFSFFFFFFICNRLQQLSSFSTWFNINKKKIILREQ